MRIVIFANTVHTNTLTGGDRIFAECAKRWIREAHSVSIITNEVGKAFCNGWGVPKKIISVWSASWSDTFGVYVAMAVKAILSTGRALLLLFQKTDIAFASSFFVPDLFPALFLKLRNPNASFVTACYLFSTKPWGTDYSGGKIKGFLFYLNEHIAFSLLKHFGGLVLTASEFDRREFIKFQKFPANRVLALRGGVDTKFFQAVPIQHIVYDGIFVGRFHPQKCIPELIEIWEKITIHRPKAVLALVGAGNQEKELKHLVKQKKLTHNILFLGIADGLEKTRILKSSRIFVSASRFDSGNIALDEALGCGIPGIVYDLSRLHYPMGVLKIPVGNSSLFVRAIESLLSNDQRRKKLGEDALAFSLSLDWDKKAKELLAFMVKYQYAPIV